MLTFDQFIEHLTQLCGCSKSMLRILHKHGPLKPTEFEIRAEFDTVWDDDRRNKLLDDLIEHRLVETAKTRLGVELIQLTPDGKKFVESVERFILDLSAKPQ